MDSVNLYDVLYCAVVKFLGIPLKYHCTYHIGYYSHYFHNDQYYQKTITCYLQLSIYTIQYLQSISIHFQMDVQFVITTIGPDLTLWIVCITQNHYSHDLHHFYYIITNWYLQSNCTILVLYNMLQYPGYHFSMVILAGSQWHMCGGKDLANNSQCS